MEVFELNILHYTKLFMCSCIYMSYTKYIFVIGMYKLFNIVKNPLLAELLTRSRIY